MTMSFYQSLIDELVCDTNLTAELGPIRTVVRDCFLACGSMSDPCKSYHLEFTPKPENEESLLQALQFFGVSLKKTIRKEQLVLYIKNAEGIADVLNIIGAHKSMLLLESIRVSKHKGNDINRKVNFETANISKTVDAAQMHIDAIYLIQQHKGLNFLPKPLRDIALLRLEDDSLSLKEIGALLNPPISKSAVNHRMRKICKIAADLNTTPQTT